MTTVIRRSTAPSIAAAIAGLILAGCGSGANQVDAAAIVGNDTISLDQVQHDLNTVLDAQPQARQAQQDGQLDQVSRNILTSQVIHQLVMKAQRDEGIVVTDEQVDQLIDSNGGTNQVATDLLDDPAGVREVAHDQLVEIALARKYTDSLTVGFDYLVANDRQEATIDANRLATNPGSISDLVRAATASGSTGQLGAHVTLAQYLQQPSEQLAPLFGTMPNTVVAFQPDPSNAPQWIVALIHDRSAHATGGQDSAGSPDSADLSTLAQVGSSLLQPVAHQLGVQISPRYGVWDFVGMRVVASADQTNGIGIPTHAGQQS